MYSEAVTFVAAVLGEIFCKIYPTEFSPTEYVFKLYPSKIGTNLYWRLAESNAISTIKLDPVAGSAPNVLTFSRFGTEEISREYSRSLDSDCVALPLSIINDLGE